MTMIRVTEKQMDFIESVMKKMDMTFDETVEYLIVVGILETQFREDYR